MSSCVPGLAWPGTLPSQHTGEQAAPKWQFKKHCNPLPVLFFVLWEPSCAPGGAGRGAGRGAGDGKLKLQTQVAEGGDGPDTGCSPRGQAGVGGAVLVQLPLTGETSLSLLHGMPSMPDTAVPADSSNCVVKDTVLPRQGGTPGWV